MSQAAGETPEATGTGKRASRRKHEKRKPATPVAVPFTMREFDREDGLLRLNLIVADGGRRTFVLTQTGPQAGEVAVREGELVDAYRALAAVLGRAGR